MSDKYAPPIFTMPPEEGERGKGGLKYDCSSRYAYLATGGKTRKSSSMNQTVENKQSYRHWEKKNGPRKIIKARSILKVK